MHEASLLYLEKNPQHILWVWQPKKKPQQTTAFHIKKNTTSPFFTAIEQEPIILNVVKKSSVDLSLKTHSNANLGCVSVLCVLYGCAIRFVAGNLAR